MTRRIYLNFLGLILLCVLVLSILVSFIFYHTTKNHEVASIKDHAKLISELLNDGIDNWYAAQSNDDYPYGSHLSGADGNNKNATRMTILTPAGAVIFDNTAKTNALASHQDREEFQEALLKGTGESIRYSNTSRNMTYYYAVKLQDGNVLRISRPVNSLAGITAFLPGMILTTVMILLLANLAARRLTTNIVKPINEIDLESDNITVYHELLPYIKKIDQQKSEIRDQIATLNNRTNTIRTIIENMKEGLILVDHHGTVLSLNKSILELFDATEMVGRSLWKICPEPELQQGLQQCLLGHHLELPFKKKKTIYNLYFSPVYSDDHISGAIILFFEATEKYQAEKQRKEFSANVSHELKTPLTTISGLAELMENGMVKPEDISAFAAKISGQAKRLINIIEDIIRLSEFDEGRMQQDYSRFDLYDLADSVLVSLSDQAKTKQVDLRLLGEQMNIWANRRMIDELLYNLIDNGIKYNRQGGSVTVTLSATERFNQIVVADTGIGIPKEHRGHVFERFYRIDKSRSKRTGGTGLGLSIIKHIIEHHEGRIEMESNEGEGTAITCFLPKHEEINSPAHLPPHLLGLDAMCNEGDVSVHK